MNELLEHVARYLTASTNHDEQQQAWDVLVALRGPDSEAHGIKMATTGVIRYTLFRKSRGDLPRGVERAIHGSLYGCDRETYVEIRKWMKTDARDPHFYAHAGAAFDALGLKWLEVNP